MAVEQEEEEAGGKHWVNMSSTSCAISRRRDSAVRVVAAVSSFSRGRLRTMRMAIDSAGEVLLGAAGRDGGCWRISIAGCCAGEPMGREAGGERRGKVGRGER